ncbi:MAG: hypothetical protein CM15mP120_11510 [Pseudomonadota bacterium]|nr:MAG: hypothetical protein CM15mP120_11510 [Pseudomonadota bacterium]
MDLAHPTFTTFRLTALYSGTLVELLHHGFERRRRRWRTARCDEMVGTPTLIRSAQNLRDRINVNQPELRSLFSFVERPMMNAKTTMTAAIPR